MTRLEAFCCAVLLALLVLLIAIPSPAQEPSDPHANQPDHCANAPNVPAANKCECHKAPNSDGGGCDIEDKKCKLYCKKDHCHCVHVGCTS